MVKEGKCWKCEDCGKMTTEKSYTKAVTIEPKINLSSVDRKVRYKKKILHVCKGCT